jgi:uncharacterized protein
MDAGFKILRRSAYVTLPWKNGGGITHEVIRVPADGAAFRWRVSIAEIQRSGPFSDFAGYGRTMALLRGAGLVLRFGGGTSATLAQVGEFAQFDGATATHCELLAGSCVDFNLMLAQPAGAVARVLSLGEGIDLRAQAAQTALIFPLEEPIVVRREGHADAQLSPWDLAILEHGAVHLAPSERDARFLFASFSR